MCDQHLQEEVKQNDRHDNKDALQEADISARAYHVTAGSRIDCSPEGASRPDQSTSANPPTLPVNAP